jgi:hypothetical protein
VLAVEEEGPALLVMLDGIPEFAGAAVGVLDDETALGVVCGGCTDGVGAIGVLDADGDRLGFFCEIGVVASGVTGVTSGVGTIGVGAAFG